MPLNLDLNGKKIRITPTGERQSMIIPEYSVVVIRDWELLINLKKIDKKMQD
ncbi:MAG: hypothetical protein V3S22_03110 [Candidatus Neomarinimicrobiota bacterium]